MGRTAIRPRQLEVTPGRGHRTAPDALIAFDETA
jgi:hypothetical protein